MGSDCVADAESGGHSQPDHHLHRGRLPIPQLCKDWTRLPGLHDPSSPNFHSGVTGVVLGSLVRALYLRAGLDPGAQQHRARPSRLFLHRRVREPGRPGRRVRGPVEGAVPARLVQRRVYGNHAPALSTAQDPSLRAPLCPCLVLPHTCLVLCPRVPGCLGPFARAARDALLSALTRSRSRSLSCARSRVLNL